MEVQAYKGYFDDGDFYSAGKIVTIPDFQEVTIEISNKSVKKTEKTQAEREEWWNKFNLLIVEAHGEEQKQKRKWLDNFFNTLNSAETDLKEENFPRFNFENKTFSFKDEE